MPEIELKKTFWNLELESKPDFEMSMKRINAWYEGEMVDRVPVRFSSHNAEYDIIDANKSQMEELKRALA